VGEVIPDLPHQVAGVRDLRRDQAKRSSQVDLRGEADIRASSEIVVFRGKLTEQTVERCFDAERADNGE
jgi:hypothetical protein